MLVQNLTRWGNLHSLGWGTCAADAWEMMALRTLKGALLVWLGRQIKDSGITWETDDPGGGPGPRQNYSDHLPTYKRFTPAGLPEYDGAKWKTVNKQLRKECKALLKKARKTL